MDSALWHKLIIIIILFIGASLGIYGKRFFRNSSAPPSTVILQIFCWISGIGMIGYAAYLALMIGH